MVILSGSRERIASPSSTSYWAGSTVSGKRKSKWEPLFSHSPKQINDVRVFLMHATSHWHTGEAGKLLWESPAKTLAEHHWHYRKQIPTLVMVQRKRMLSRKTKQKSFFNFPLHFILCCKKKGYNSLNCSFLRGLRGTNDLVSLPGTSSSTLAWHGKSVHLATPREKLKLYWHKLKKIKKSGHS